MNQGKIVVRYSKSLFELAVEKKVLDKVYQDMQTVADLLREVPALKTLLERPVISAAKKIEVARNVFASLDKLTLSFIEYVIKKSREEFLSDITRYFMILYRQEKGIREAMITTAIPIDTAITENIKKIMKDMNCEVMLTAKVDPSIIGGYILKIEDRQYDSSVVNNLSKIRTELGNTTIK